MGMVTPKKLFSFLLSLSLIWTSVPSDALVSAKGTDRPFWSDPFATAPFNEQAIIAQLLSGKVLSFSDRFFQRWERVRAAARLSSSPDEAPKPEKPKPPHPRQAWSMLTGLSTYAAGLE